MSEDQIGGPIASGGSDHAGGVAGDGSRNVVIRGIGQPPAFLTKTFLMVDDPNTNSIISWGKFGDSFIIWDHMKFSEEIMSKYFKHNNLASFVYQLNNYGFRKIGVEHQWEYSNPNFQSGKQHLLMNMKRRSSQQNPTTRRRKSTKTPEVMRDAINESKLEIEKLKMQQLDMDFHIVALKQEARNVESTSRKLMVCWAKACDIIAKTKRGRGESDDEAVAKRKKSVEETEIETKDKVVDDDDEIVKENHQLFSSTSSSINDHSVLDESKQETVVGNFSNDLDVWRKMLMDDDGDEVCEVEVGNEMAKQRDKIAQDFQEWLIERDDGNSVVLKDAV